MLPITVKNLFSPRTPNQLSSFLYQLTTRVLWVLINPVNIVHCEFPVLPNKNNKKRPIITEFTAVWELHPKTFLFPLMGNMVISFSYSLIHWKDDITYSWQQKTRIAVVCPFSFSGARWKQGLYRLKQQLSLCLCLPLGAIPTGYESTASLSGALFHQSGSQAEKIPRGT